MITLNETMGGNLLIILDDGKEARQDLIEIIERASNTDGILTDLLDASNYLGNNWLEATGALTEMPLIGWMPIYSDDEDIDFPIDYEKVFGYEEYQIKSFAQELLKQGRVVFRKYC